MNEMTSFVDVLPLSSLKTCLSLVKGQEANRRDIALAVLNLSSYAAGQFIPVDGPLFAMPSGGQTMTATPLSLVECEAILVDLLPDDTGTMKAGRIDREKLLDLAKTLLPILLRFLI